MLYTADIKPENFLFSSPAADATLKLIDFGQSVCVRPFETIHRVAGTVYYMSPQQAERNFDSACDVWSCGVILYMMLYGGPPFDGDSDEDIYRAIQKGFKPETRPGSGAWFPSSVLVSSTAKDLLARLLRSNVEERITAYDATIHPWLRELGTAAGYTVILYFFSSSRCVLFFVF